MGTYQRKIAYLYEYYNQKREKNVGFIKIDSLQGGKRVLVQFRGDYQKDKMTCNLVLPKDGTVYGFFELGQLQLIKGMWTFSVDISEQKNVDLQEVLSSSIGILIVLEENRYLGATWNDKPLYEAMNQFQIEQFSIIEDFQETSFEKEITKETIETSGTPQDNYDSAELTVFRKILQEYPSMLPIPELNEGECVRFEPKDIGALPIRYWCLSGNPFLMQGYCRYRHLIFASMKEEGYVIGVPGVFSEREKQEGEKMGFTIFKPLCKCSGCKGAFGYWFMKLLKDGACISK